METTTIIQRKRKADQREQQTSSRTKSHHRHQHHHHHRHLRIEAPKFIGVSEATTITTTSPPSSREEEFHVALIFAPPSRPVTPREMQVDDRPPPPSPAGGLRPTTPSPSPSPAAEEEAAGGGGVEGEDGAATTTTTTAEEEASLASLPVELFCNVVAYLGPTSSSLCALCRVSRHHNAVMTSIGDVMLRRARLRFRVPLPPRTSGGAIGGGDDGRGVATTTIVESSVSLFVRHARVSKAVHDRLEGLVGTMRRWGPFFPGPPSSSVPDDDASSSPSSSRGPSDDASPSDGHGASALAAPTGRVSDRVDRRDPAAARCDDDAPTATVVGPSEVRRALDVALCLLGMPDRDYFEDDPDLAHLIASQSSTTALERRVHAVCGAVGARSYKYAKSRMCRLHEEGGGGWARGWARGTSCTRTMPSRIG